MTNLFSKINNAKILSLLSNLEKNIVVYLEIKGVMFSYDLCDDSLNLAQFQLPSMGGTTV